MNYTNLILPINPILTVDIKYEIEEKVDLSDEHKHEHEHIFLLIEGNKFLKKYEVGEDIPFQIIGKHTVRMFVPLEGLKISGPLRFSILEGKKELISTNIVITLDKKIRQKPIVLSEKSNRVELPKAGETKNKIFFISTYDIVPKAVLNGRSYNLTVFSDSKFKMLKYVNITFTNTGLFKFLFDNEEIIFNVEEDKTPPDFMLLVPTNNSVFYTTNVMIKWTDPIDLSGVNFLTSCLTLQGENFYTNISPLFSLNKESSINNYEVVKVCLPYGKYFLELSYLDNSGNSKTEYCTFFVENPSRDKERPYITRSYLEGVIKKGEFYFSNQKDLVLFIEASDGIYGSGLSRIHYNLNGKYQFEPMLSNVKYINIYLSESTNYLLFFVEDNNSNFSGTNSFTIILEK